MQARAPEGCMQPAGVINSVIVNRVLCIYTQHCITLHMSTYALRALTLPVH